jgi:NAD(P)-dependent dehydrogenase (short-subunit alcohol dehydrogenase family)
LSATFKGEIAMVTGAASGIGQACAEMLAAGGAKVALVDVSAGNLEDVRKGIADGKGTARGYELNVANVAEIGPIVSRIRKEMGEIAILICSAGINRPGQAENITETDYDSMMSVNTKGLFFCNQEVARQSMIPRRAGSIVNIGSISGLIGMAPPLSSAVYQTSKGAVMTLTRQLAVEWARHRIRVNGVAPGFVPTRMTQPLVDDRDLSGLVRGLTPLGDFQSPSDMAAAACFLAGESARMITGVILTVDGGYTAQ